MGNEYSQTQIDESMQPKTLSSRSVQAVADYILSGKVKKVVFMVCIKLGV